MADLKAFAKVAGMVAIAFFCAATASAQKLVRESIHWSDNQIREYLSKNPADTCLYDRKKLGEKDGKYYIVERKKVALFNGEPRLFRDTVPEPMKRLHDMKPEEFRAVCEGRMQVLNADRQKANGEKIRKTTVSVAAGASAGKKGVAPMVEANIGFETRNWLVGAGIGWTEAWYPSIAEYANDRYSMPYFQANAGFKVWKSQDFDDYIAVGAKGLLGFSKSDSDKATVYSHKWGFGGGLYIEGMWGIGRNGWRLGFNAAGLIMPYNEGNAGQNLIKDLRGSAMFKVMKTF